MASPFSRKKWGGWELDWKNTPMCILQMQLSVIEGLLSLLFVFWQTYSRIEAKILRDIILQFSVSSRSS